MRRAVRQSGGDADVLFGARTLLAAIAALLVFVPFALLLLLVQSAWPPLRHADTSASVDLHRYARAHPTFVTSQQVVSIIGTSLAWTVILGVVVVWLLWRRLPRLAIFAAVTAIGSSLLNNLVKVSVDRARPVLPNPVETAAGFSFPSGHAQAAVVGYGILVVIFVPILPRRARIGAVAFAVFMVAAIGFSRIALGVHYLSDVLAGYVLGAAWLVAMIAAFNAWRADRGKPTGTARDGLEPEQKGRIAITEVQRRDPPDSPAADE